MALTDEGNMIMPVAPMYGGNGGGFGGANNFAADGAMLYPWMNQSNQMQDGFTSQMLNNSVGNIQNAITSGFGDVQTALCGGFAGVNASVNGAQNGITQMMYNNQIADLERSFNCTFTHTNIISYIFHS